MNEFIELTQNGKRVLISIDSIDFIEDAPFEKTDEKCKIHVNGSRIIVEENYELIYAIIQEVLKK